MLEIPGRTTTKSFHCIIFIINRCQKLWKWILFFQWIILEFYCDLAFPLGDYWRKEYKRTSFHLFIPSGKNIYKKTYFQLFISSFIPDWIKHLQPCSSLNSGLWVLNYFSVCLLVCPTISTCSKLLITDTSHKPWLLINCRRLPWPGSEKTFDFWLNIWLLVELKGGWKVALLLLANMK